MAIIPHTPASGRFPKERSSNRVQRLLRRSLWAIVTLTVVIVLALGVIRPMMKQPKTNALSLDDHEPGSLDAIAADPFVSLKDYASERQDDAAAILQEWLDEDRKFAVNE